MIKAVVTYTKEIEVTVVGETLEEIEAAANAAAEGQDLEDYACDWDVRVSKCKDWVLPGQPTLTVAELRCHEGVLDGKLVHIMDYNKAKGASVPEAKD